MAEYIEKEALRLAIFNTMWRNPKDVDIAYDMAENVSAADVVEVVRCSECIHQEDCMKQLVFWKRDHVLEQNVYQYHELQFCSYGERRSE